MLDLDIYFDSNYGKLYEEIEDGRAIVYDYDSSNGKIRHSFIKREIPFKINDQNFYDIVTPYGYGGPLILESDNKNQLVTEFEREFQNYCDQNNIVSEFIRFHPILANYKEFQDIYYTIYLRNTVGTSLKYDENPFNIEFSKSTRKTVRRSFKSGLSYRIIEQPQDLSTFMKIYYSTMSRNNASGYYYFDEKYFEKCLKYFKQNMILVEVVYDGKVIASSINFRSNNTVHVHLSGTLTDYINMSPAYIIKFGTLEWAKENGMKLIHYGGGTSNNQNDSLYNFKKKFTKNTEFEFHIGKKVWNQDIYNSLCSKVNVDNDSDFFPAYRNLEYTEVGVR